MNERVLNIVLPGAGLLLADHLLSAIGLLGATLLCVAAALIWPMFTAQGLLWTGLAVVVGVYVLLMGLAEILWRVHETAPRYVRTQVEANAREIQAAWLRGEHADVLPRAKALALQASDLPGAWRLYQQCAASAGDSRAAAYAQQRAAWLERRARERLVIE